MEHMTIEQLETLLGAVHEFGALTQQVKAMEELGELIQAIAKILNAPNLAEDGPEAYHLAEEMADVEIMLEQLKIIYRNHGIVDDWRAIKLGRLKKRLKDRKARTDP